MFTGLINHTATLSHATDLPHSRQFHLTYSHNDELTSRLKVGSSIACDGTCLTVDSCGVGFFDVYASPETCSLTTLQQWRPGRTIHIEPSMRMGDAMDGHIVYGHVDGLAKITSIKTIDNARRYTLSPPESLLPFLARKGSVAVDGVSLTIASFQNRHFDIVLIPQTLSFTHLGQRAVGDQVNLEVDMLARYVIHALETTYE